MGKTPKILIGLAFLGLGLGSSWAFNDTDRPKKDTCSGYITVDTVKREYKGSWRGDMITLTDTNGLEHDVNDTRYYKGQRVCLDQL